ncbi:protein phosphatase 2C zeta, putative, partial [Ixodes scapularis]
MLNRFKNAIYNVVGGLDALPTVKDGEPAGADRLPLKFKYTRPSFLQLTSDDEIQVSADHVIRPIIVPRDITKIPWNAGYAEAINAGKSLRNEDQGAIFRGAVRRHVQAAPREPRESGSKQNISSVLYNDLCFFAVQVEQMLPWVYFALFDGHAGSGVAVAASNTLQKIIQIDTRMKCVELKNILSGMVQVHLKSWKKLSLPTSHFYFLAELKQGSVCAECTPDTFCSVKKISTDSLIIGALETAFWDMDKQIARDKKHYKMTGGCTVLVALFILGKLYLANAGDSRAIICRGDKVIPMSADFTPESERSRIKHLVSGHREKSALSVCSEMQFQLVHPDFILIGKIALAYKTITTEDLKFPLIYGEGKRSRVLATIGVTRGFGDHDLKAQSSNVDIKPFLTAEPEAGVRVFDVNSEELTEGDVLVMGTDGLWDVMANEKAAEIVQKSLDHFPANDTQRVKYISAAQDLVMHSRGKLKERNWRTADNRAATIDDISVFVIPLKSYQDEH